MVELYLIKVVKTNKGDKKLFPEKQKLREFVAGIPAL